MGAKGLDGAALMPYRDDPNFVVTLPTPIVRYEVETRIPQRSLEQLIAVMEKWLLSHDPGEPVPEGDPSTFPHDPF